MSMQFVTGCCRAAIVVTEDWGDDRNGVRWAPWLCGECGTIVGWRADAGELDLGVIRSEVEGANDLQHFDETLSAHIRQEDTGSGRVRQD